MPRKRHMLRWCGKWAGLVVCMMVVVACLASIQRTFIYRTRYTAVWLDRGFLQICTQTVGRDPADEEWRSCWIVSRRHLPGRWWSLRHRIGRDPQQKLVHLWTAPLWIPLLIAVVLTTYLWYRDRRAPPGHCQHCGYDLTGNVSGVCPECGEKI